MKFANLTKAQKRFVVAVIENDETFATKTEVTRKELVDAYWAMHEKRAANAPKIGFPNWLCNVAKTGRGTYTFPAPSVAELTEYNTTATPVVVKKNTPATAKAREKLDQIMRTSEPVVSVSDEEFLKELQEAGIEV